METVNNDDYDDEDNFEWYIRFVRSPIVSGS